MNGYRPIVELMNTNFGAFPHLSHFLSWVWVICPLSRMRGSWRSTCHGFKSRHGIGLCAACPHQLLTRPLPFPILAPHPVPRQASTAWLRSLRQATRMRRRGANS
jgi:hypothetical protein